MSICREWSLVKTSPTERESKLLYCRSWSCPVCAPRRQRQLCGQSVGGAPTRFITLTIRPTVGDSPYDRLLILSNSWRLVVKRLRRLHPGGELEYLAVVEATQAGEPHLHILLRGPYIPQRWLSAVMDELADSPIVDIRRIKSLREVVSYVCKYIAKAPAQFGSAKRYWTSQHYTLDPLVRPIATSEGRGCWKVDMRPIAEILREWLYAGFVARPDGQGGYHGVAAAEHSLLYEPWRLRLGP